ncbi:hypothetical protein N0V84_001018 [Fusarium piperis]|uniref:Zn(2)-C6 fungal-type domain-containing protein n=1 Tax=Fusarium piperis TaxID=1435070 RepID=A0A9W9BTF6_9HYPO|nr:hypothetical protein N0V84_001018 [Fusarium piperis]
MFPFHTGNNPDVIKRGKTRPNRRSATREPIDWNTLPKLAGSDYFPVRPAPPIFVTPVDPPPLVQQQQPSVSITPVRAPLVPAGAGPMTRARRKALGDSISTSPVPYPSNIPRDVIRGAGGSRLTTSTIPREECHSEEPSDQGQQSQLLNPNGKLMVPRKRQRNNTSGRASKRAKTATLAAAQGNIPLGPCDFCVNHDVGQGLYAQDDVCNFEVVQGTGKDVYLVECQHCADYRNMNPGVSPAHVCVVDGLEFTHNRYGNAGPAWYPEDSVCKRCVKFGFEQTCDADPILGYKCSNCRPDYSCVVAGSALPNKRPNKLRPFRPWYRHACDRCRSHALEDGKLKGFEKCSWLDNRVQWQEDVACSRCVRDGMSCIDSGNLIWENSAVKPPEDWSIDEGYKIVWNLADLTRQTFWRKPCDACILSNVKCQVHLSRTAYACERCSQIGVGCVSDFGITRVYWPLYSLSLVGFGPHMPFTACKNCRVNNRACDRQRPCDSCVSNGEKTECDPYQRGKKQNTLPRPEMGNLGPLYYLSMGFTGDGVNSTKIGTDPEDWIGPSTQRYAVDNFEQDGPERYEDILDAHKHYRPPPPAKPPNGAQYGHLLAKRNMQEFKRDELRQMIQDQWPNYQNPCQFDDYGSVAAELEAHLPKNPPVEAPAFGSIARFNPATRTVWARTRRTRRPQGEPVPVPPRKRTRAQQARGQPEPPFSDLFAQQLQQTSVYQFPSHHLDMPQPGHGYDRQQPLSQPELQSTAGPFDNTYGSQLDVAADWAQRRAERRQRRQPGNNDGDYSFGRSMKPAVGTLNPPEPPVNTRQVIPSPSNASSSRAPQDARAVEHVPFNPFLGFAMNGETRIRYNSKPRNSRWKVLNPLEDLDMSHWHVARHHPDNSNKTRPHIFNMSEGRRLPVPFRDVLRDVPREEAEQQIQERCVEPNNGGLGYCSRENSFRINCQSLAHSNTPPYHFPVCNQCHVASITDLFRQQDKPITRKDLVDMRAYLCHDCAEHISSKAQNVLDYKDAGARIVHGTYANDDAPKGIYNLDDDPENAVEFRPNPKPGTGCFCADKVLGAWLCRYHRLYYAEEMLKQAKLVHEWRLSYFKKPVCPGCLANKPLNEVNVSADHHNFKEGGPTAWACLACSEWVVNQKNDKHNKPNVVKGALRTAERITDLFARVTEPLEDVKMSSG